MADTNVLDMIIAKGNQLASAMKAHAEALGSCSRRCWSTDAAKHDERLMELSDMLKKHIEAQQ